MAGQYNWEWENNINSSNELIDINTPQEHKYNAWRTNSSLSNFNETIHHANWSNLNYHLSNKLHYHYLFYSIRKKKRYGKKKTEEDKKFEQQQKAYNELLSLIQEHYKYNVVRAKEALKILTKEQINIIIKKQEKGG
jgi:hypothetical protein